MLIGGTNEHWVCGASLVVSNALVSAADAVLSRSGVAALLLDERGELLWVNERARTQLSLADVEVAAGHCFDASRFPILASAKLQAAASRRGSSELTWYDADRDVLYAVSMVEALGPSEGDVSTAGTLVLVREATSEHRARAEAAELSDVRALVAELLLIGLSDDSLEGIIDQSLLCILAIPWLSSTAAGTFLLACDEGSLFKVSASFGVGNVAKGQSRSVGEIPAIADCLASGLVFRRGCDGCLDAASDGEEHGHWWLRVGSAERSIGVIDIRLEGGHEPGPVADTMLRSAADVIATVIERRRAEAARVKLSRALEQIGEGVVVTDTRGIIDFVNPAMAGIIGVPAAGLLGSRFALFGLEGGSEHVHEALWTALASGETWTRRLGGTRTNGSRYMLDVVFSPVRDGDGRITNFVGAVRDTSRETQLEDELRQAQKMDALGKLAGGVSHDFNNILAVIHGNASLLIGALEADDARWEDAKEIERAALRAAGLTRQLLAFSRREAVHPVVLCVNEVIADLERMLCRVLGEHVTLVNASAPPDRHVKMDPSHLDQVLLNLAINARDAMPTGGTLTIETSDVELHDGDLTSSDQRAGRYVRITVRDTGTGIAPDVLERIFEPFFTTKAEGKGTGMGLSTVYGIVRQAGGQVRVHTEVGLGTTFVVDLPWRRGQGGAASRSPSLVPRMVEAKTVLSAEDDPAVAKMVSRILQRQGYRVVEARSGEDALAALCDRGEGIDLLLTDVVLGGMSGVELALRARAKHPGLAVVFMSGHMDDELVRQGMADPTNIVRKPFDWRELVKKVRDALAARSSGLHGERGDD